ncbi:hypothetical protein WME98_40425 [Sorangium sp. So ce296]|uniref:hypothetical protein n=1 Tax=Sorangium sp. So ce296 TaxID=3133296 RepID=UPI003F625968
MDVTEDMQWQTMKASLAELSDDSQIAIVCILHLGQQLERAKSASGEAGASFLLNKDGEISGQRLRSQDAVAMANAVSRVAVPGGVTASGAFTDSTVADVVKSVSPEPQNKPGIARFLFEEHLKSTLATVSTVVAGAVAAYLLPSACGPSPAASGPRPLASASAGIGAPAIKAAAALEAPIPTSSATAAASASAPPARRRIRKP